tara:strand:- start:47 stop:1405 length:1359 start_codon:yes stop_codon:yes gene_type:complete
MGFNPFKKARKFVSKIIPNEVKPFLPYLMAAMPGGMGLSAGLQKFGGDAFLKAALTKGLSDDEADLKDIARTGIFAAAPTAIGEGLNVAGNSLINDATLGNVAGTGKLEFAQALKNAGNSSLLNPEGIMANAKMIGAQGATDYGVKQAEIAEDELDEYNRMLKEQGVGDRTERRAAIFDIFMNAGYDGDYVNEMLDGYGYADGGRAGYRYGKSVSMARGKGKQKAPESTTGITGITINAEAGDDEESMTMADFIESMKGDDGFDVEDLGTMREGLEMFYGTPMMGNAEPVPMMRFDKGGVVDIAKAKKAIAKAKKNKKPKKSKDKKYNFFDLVDKEAQDKRDDKREKELDIKYNAQNYPPSMRGNYEEGGITGVKTNGNLMGLKMGGSPMEMDYRQGGFIPVGSKERADDVPARLSKNEFVMTADAVRAAGGGSVNKGAKRMYNLMNNLEAK